MAQRFHKSGKFIKKSEDVFKMAFDRAGSFAKRHNIQLAEKGFLGTLGAVGEVASIVWGVSNRLKEGQSLMRALPLEIIEAIPWGIAPGAMTVAMLGKLAAEVAPAIQQGAEMSAYYNANFNFLGGGYLDTQTNYINRARAVEQIKRNRTGIRYALGSEARRFHQTY